MSTPSPTAGPPAGDLSAHTPMMEATRKRPASSATPTMNGQIGIPINAHHPVDDDTGDRGTSFEIEPENFEVIAATRSARGPEGHFGQPKRASSIEDMNAATKAQPEPTR